MGSDMIDGRANSAVLVATRGIAGHFYAKNEHTGEPLTPFISLRNTAALASVGPRRNRDFTGLDSQELESMLH